MNGEETSAAGCCRTSMSVTRSVSVSGDGVTTTQVHITEVRRSARLDGACDGRGGRDHAGDDDGRMDGRVDGRIGGGAGVADDAAAGASGASGAMHGCGEDCGCDCFDVETSCDEREKAMIAAIRAYLRPEQAPECLMARLNAVLDRCCGK